MTPPSRREISLHVQYNLTNSETKVTSEAPGRSENHRIVESSGWKRP